MKADRYSIIFILTLFCVGCTTHRAHDYNVTLERVTMVHGAMVPTNNMITFTGLCDSSIHRPGPEHVKLEHVKDGEIINTPTLAHYSRSSETIHSYNDMWRGARIYLYTGKGNLMFMGEVGISSLYFNTDLKKGEEYRITWACWPVGAEKAVEKEIIFKWNP